MVPNPPDGATIDYYLKSAAAGPVTLEILDARGTSLQTFTSDPTRQTAPPRRGAGGMPNTSPLWRRATDAPLSVAAGMHRIVWNPADIGGRDVFGDPNDAVPHDTTGAFTAKLTVNGRSYVQPFTIKGDPRFKAR